VEEADSGDSGCACLEAGGCVFEGDSAEGKDWDRSGGGTGGAELVETLAGEVLAGGEGLLEDGGIKDCIDLVGMGAVDLGEGVAGEGDRGFGCAGGEVEVANLDGGELVWRGGEVDTMGASCEGDVGAGVEQQARGAGGEGYPLQQVTGEACERGCGKVFFSQLDKVDAFGDPSGGFGEEGGLFLLLTAWVERTAGDGVAKHDEISVWCQGRLMRLVMLVW
jgi:hypothetical protein